MKNLFKDTIHANGIDIGIYTQDFENEFISLTDIARYKSDEPKDVIKNWMRSKDTIEFLGLWEKLHNSNFKGVEFDSFRNQAGSNAFTMSPTKWIETTGAIGIVSKSGRYIGAYDDEPATVDAMHRFMEEQGYTLNITDQRMHHEIYLSDARKIAPEKLKTVIRHPIKRA